RVVWYDARGLDVETAKSVLPRLATLRYTGVVFSTSNVADFAPLVSSTITPLLHVESREALDAVLAAVPALADRLVIGSDDVDFLSAISADGRSTCFFAYVDDRDSLHASIQHGAGFSHLVVKFRDPTNIPLELVIASLQATRTVLVKEIAEGDVDDAVV